MGAEPHALVVGTGSIGRRHLRNLAALGVGRLSAYDADPDRLAFARDDLGADGHDSLEAALGAGPDVVLVCTPPVSHVETALAAIGVSADVFVEKPLASSLDGVDGLLDAATRSGRVVQVGYNLQFEPALERVKELIDGGAIGRVVWARAEFGQYLPDWRPWQDYRRSYTARRELGGGIVLDASHELAYVMWLLGTPVEVRAMGGTVGALEVDVEDSATVLMRFADGAQADVHVDFLQRQPVRQLKAVGVDGTILLDLLSGELSLLPDGESELFPPDDDLAYRAELSHFLDCVRTRAKPRVDLAFGRDVLAVAVGALEQLA